MMTPLPRLLPLTQGIEETHESSENEAQNEFDEVSGVRPILRLVPRSVPDDVPDLTRWARLLPPEILDLTESAHLLPPEISDLTEWALLLPPELPDYAEFVTLLSVWPEIPVAAIETCAETTECLAFVHAQLEEMLLAA